MGIFAFLCGCASCPILCCFTLCLCSLLCPPDDPIYKTIPSPINIDEYNNCPENKTKVLIKVSFERGSLKVTEKSPGQPLELKLQKSTLEMKLHAFSISQLNSDQKKELGQKSLETLGVNILKEPMKIKTFMLGNGVIKRNDCGENVLTDCSWRIVRSLRDTSRIHSSRVPVKFEIIDHIFNNSTGWVLSSLCAELGPISKSDWKRSKSDKIKIPQEILSIPLDYLKKN